MTRDEAVAESKRLASEHPDRATNTWLPQQQSSGEWVVVKVPGRKAPLQRDKLQEGVESDVRPDPSQDVSQEPKPWWGGG